MPWSVPLVLAFTAWLMPVPPEKVKIAAADAKAHVGQDVTVCGKVVLVRKVAQPRVGFTWQMLVDQVSPPVFTLIANASTADNPYFVSSDACFSGKDVCASGKVFDHNGLIYIRLTAPSQIQIVKEKR